MRTHVIELLKHTSVYGLAALLARVASLVLLPVYTRYLTPSDYGVIAILDLTLNMLAILIGSGVAAAVGRYHFENHDESRRDQLWMTGFVMLMVSATLIVAPAYFYRDALSKLTLGSDIVRGGYYFALALLTLWLTSVGQLSEQFLQVEKRSGMFFALSLAQLLTNVALNLIFLIPLGLGIGGILLGNLIANGIFVFARTAIMLRHRGRMGLDADFVRPLLKFGLPLLMTAMLALAMHQADRFFLKTFASLREVGLYSLAYAIGQGVNSLMLTPFQMIWRVKSYEFAESDDAEVIYCHGFKWFLGSLLLLMFGLSLFARPLISIMASEDFQFSAELIPLICLGYWFFSAATFFNLPMLLEKQTTALLPASAFSVLVNLCANWVLVPRMGAMGAGLATLITFLTLATVAYFVGRLVRPIRFPIHTMAMALAFVLGVWGLWRYYLTPGSGQLLVYSSAAVLWCVTGLVFVVTMVPLGEAREMLRGVTWKETPS